jgi:hypothetical protein
MGPDSFDFFPLIFNVTLVDVLDMLIYDLSSQVYIKV